jgi:N-acetylmuramoyl-L-alanine amidase
MKKIYLSPSEQPENRYAYGNTNEKAVCREISAVVEKALKRNGFEVINASGTLSARCKEADKWGADLYIPIHTNAFDGKVSGTRMFCYRTSGEGYNACKAIYNVLAPLTPGKSENIKARPELYEVKTPKAPTVYIEVDFHDVPSVAKWIIEHTEEIGETICKGICNHYGVTYKTEAKTEAKPETKDKLYRVQVGAYRNKSGAENLLAKLKRAGFDGYIKEE